MKFCFSWLFLSKIKALSHTIRDISEQFYRRRRPRWWRSFKKALAKVKDTKIMIKPKNRFFRGLHLWAVAFREAKIVLKIFLYNFLVRNSCVSGFWRETHLTPPNFHKTSSCPATSVSEFRLNCVGKKGKNSKFLFKNLVLRETRRKLHFFDFFKNFGK